MYVGIDVGGTNLKAGLVDETGRILAVERTPLDFQGPEAFAATLAELSQAVMAAGGAAPSQVEYVGVGLPGAVSGGDVVYTTNIPMENVPLEALFRHTLDLPLLLGNDADCAAVGEYFQGAGRGLRDFVVLTLGTGLGAGIILDGRLRGGESSSEAGHMVLHAGGEPCPCGRRGCWEQYASATALIRRTEAAMAAHPESALCRLAEEAGGVDGRTPFLAAEAGDETALAVCRAYVEELAEGTASLINILRPEAVAFGGGVAGAPEHLLLEPLRRRVGALCFSRHGGRATRILRAELGNDAGVIGAALLGRVI
ncbi:ROK family protein [Dysosmobacter welbionis]|mgnify:CR=1 FL=1|uniref:ROK family protein n=1 Tax=Dysosmobacter welbionis TaxID=2093857 RepID=UPI002942A08F|nr:ROK family protein [Dysosmobacter welbionis]